MIADVAEADRSLIKQVIKNMIYNLGLGIRLSVPPERLATISDAYSAIVDAVLSRGAVETPVYRRREGLVGSPTVAGRAVGF